MPSVCLRDRCRLGGLFEVFEVLGLFGLRGFVVGVFGYIGV